MRGKDTVDRHRWKIVQGAQIVDDLYTKLIPAKSCARTRYLEAEGVISCIQQLIDPISP
jgi:hypothetical protein